jgi:hypothetical protein
MIHWLSAYKCLIRLKVIALNSAAISPSGATALGSLARLRASCEASRPGSEPSTTIPAGSTRAYVAQARAAAPPPTAARARHASPGCDPESLSDRPS